MSYKCIKCGSKYIKMKSSGENSQGTWQMFECINCKHQWRIIEKREDLPGGKLILVLNPGRAKDWVQFYQMANSTIAIRLRHYNEDRSVTFYNQHPVFVVGYNDADQKCIKYYPPRSSELSYIASTGISIYEIELGPELGKSALQNESMRLQKYRSSNGKAFFEFPNENELLLKDNAAWLRSVTGGIAEIPKDGGCYIATAVYGSYDCPEVWTLRRFRDNVLVRSWCGRVFIKLYYGVSPALVKLFGKKEWFNKICRPVLDKIVHRLNIEGIKNTPYQDKQ